MLLVEARSFYLALCRMLSLNHIAMNLIDKNTLSPAGECGHRWALRGRRPVLDTVSSLQGSFESCRGYTPYRQQECRRCGRCQCLEQQITLLDIRSEQQQQQRQHINPLWLPCVVRHVLSNKHASVNRHTYPPITFGHTGIARERERSLSRVWEPMGIEEGGGYTYRHASSTRRWVQTEDLTLLRYCWIE